MPGLLTPVREWGYKTAQGLRPRAQVAQLVEQWTENPRVGGSNPPLGTIIPHSRCRGGPLRPHWIVTKSSSRRHM